MEKRRGPLSSMTRPIGIITPFLRGFYNLIKRKDSSKNEKYEMENYKYRLMEHSNGLFTCILTINLRV